MNFKATGFLFLLTITIGFLLFHIKHQVLDAEIELAKITRAIDVEEENLHVLEAEWAYLNEPKRLQALAQKYLDIAPPASSQMVTLASMIDQVMSPSILATGAASDKVEPTLASWGGQ